MPLVLAVRLPGLTVEGHRVIASFRRGLFLVCLALPPREVHPIPDGLEDGAALALLIQGLTAWHLLKTSAKVAQGESVVVISGAGGVGSLAVQLAKPFGAGRVIATASTEEKRSLAMSLGADAVVDPSVEDLTAALVEANDGNQVDVVLEMSGGRVFSQSAEALAPFGRIVAYGIAGREQNTLETGRLLRKSRGVVGFWLMHCLGRPEMVEEPLADMFERAARGELRPQMGETYALSDVRRGMRTCRGGAPAARAVGSVALDQLPQQIRHLAGSIGQPTSRSFAAGATGSNEVRSREAVVFRTPAVCRVLQPSVSTMSR